MVRVSPPHPARWRAPSGLAPRSEMLLVLLLLLALAWFNRFVQDDAFISFRYAENLVHGQGLVWNAGERVEGYTNFLWILLISVPMALGFDPVPSSQVLGILFFSATLIVTYRLSRSIFSSTRLALLTIVLLGTNYSFSAYATGGLETQMQTCLVTTSFLLALQVRKREAPSAGLLLSLSLLLGLSVLTRMDSLIAVAVIGCVPSVGLLRRDATPARKIADLSLLSFPLILLVGCWLLWKRSYYGEILPNTFYVKVSSGSSIERGLHYCSLFLNSYLLTVFPLLALVSVRRIPPPARLPVAALFAFLSLWLAYTVAVGGDFMEFRFLVVALPPAFVLIAWLIAGRFARPTIRIALIALVLCGSLRHALRFQSTGGVASIGELRSYLEEPWQNWDEVGRALARLFERDSGVTIATTASGAVPYYSGLETVDMLGLNDRWIARHGIAIGEVPGHQRTASFDYLLDRGVNLVVGHPQVQRHDRLWRTAYRPEALKRFRLVDVPRDRIPPGSRVVEIPLDPDYKLTVLYLIPHPAVEAAIRTHRLRTFRVVLESGEASP